MNAAPLNADAATDAPRALPPPPEAAVEPPLPPPRDADPTTQQQQTPRIVQSSAGAGSGYLRQLAASLPADAAAKQLDAYLPDFLRAYTNGADADDTTSRERVLCARVQLIPLRGNAGTRRVVLLGYRNGFQAWKLEDSGVATEMCNARDAHALGPVAHCHVTQAPPAPDSEAGELAHTLASARPLVALASGVEASAPHMQSVVTLFSLRMCKPVHALQLESPVTGVQSSARVLAVGLRASVAVFDAQTLERKFSIACQPAASLRDEAVFALSDRWLAVGGARPVTGAPEDVTLWRDEKASGRAGDSGLESPMADAASRAARELWRLGDLGRQRLSSDTHLQQQQQQQQGQQDRLRDEEADVASETSGGVVVHDVMSHASPAAPVAHFASHAAQLELLRFDASGALLAVSARGGQAVHVHRIFPRRNKSDAAAAASHRLVCRLQRGRTRAVIRDMSFSADMRWAAVTSARGTTHLFALNPAGGAATTRSHPTLDTARLRAAGIFVDSGGSSGGGDGGWALRARFASLSSSLTHAASPVTVPAGLSSSLGSLSSRGSDLLARAAAAASAAAAGAASAGSGGALADLQPSALTPVLSPAALNGQLRDADTVSASALARVRLRTRATLLEHRDRHAPEETAAEAAGARAEEAVASTERAAVVCGVLDGSALLAVTGSGLVEQFQLAPLRAERDARELLLRALPWRSWDLCRRAHWPELLRPAPRSSSNTSSSSSSSSSSNVSAKALRPATPKSDGPANDDAEPAARAAWMARAEIATHAAPLTAVWAAPQFTFATFDADDGAAPLFVERLRSSRVQVRGSGPAPSFSRGADGDMRSVRSAMRTPAATAQLRETADGDLDRHVLVFDDEEASPRTPGSIPESPEQQDDDEEEEQEEDLLGAELEWDGFVLPESAARE